MQKRSLICRVNGFYMRTNSGQSVHLADYQAPAFTVHDIHLDIRLDPEQTVVISTMTIERVANADADMNAPLVLACLLYTSPSPRDQRGSRMPSSA